MLPEAEVVLLEVFSDFSDIGFGRVCGGRFAAVWLGDSLELLSCTFEPFELSDLELCRSRALAFVAQVEAVRVGFET
jgi:hypothetical protein